MTTVDRLWYLADEAAQQAEQTYHRVAERHESYMEFTLTRWVSRPRFQTIVDRIRDNGLPYGSHSVVRSPDGALLLVRHSGVEKWVLPGGEVGADEDFRAAAQRELAEEAGIETALDGLGLLGRVEFHTEGHETWGVLPIFETATAREAPTVRDPDGEIVAAEWFEELPADTRDREVIETWRRRVE